MADLILWASGEADLTHARLVSEIEEPTTEHYVISSSLGLDGCLDDLERYVGFDQ